MEVRQLKTSPHIWNTNCNGQFFQSILQKSNEKLCDSLRIDLESIFLTKSLI